MVNLTARFVETDEDKRLFIEGQITKDFARKYLFITAPYSFFPSDSEVMHDADKEKTPFVSYLVASRQAADELLERINQNLKKDGHNITSHS